jgi:hypothetical protein
MEVKVIVSDLQIPYHHRRAVASVCNMLSDRRRDITEVFQIGDFYEFEAVSRWVKGTAREDGRTLQRELKVAEELLTMFADAYPNVKTRIKGNHDDRLDKYLSVSARGLDGLDVLEYDTFTQAERFGWKTVAQPYRLAPSTNAVHGLCVRSKSGYTAHSHLDKMGGNVIHGHTHRAGLIFRTLGNETRWGMEAGSLCDRRLAPYGVAGIFDWQLAFGILEIDGSDVNPRLILVRDDGSFTFDGRRYRP